MCATREGDHRQPTSFDMRIIPATPGLASAGVTRGSAGPPDLDTF